MDVTNPGLVNVASQVQGNPDPNGGSYLILPPIAERSEPLPPPASGVTSEVFAIPTSVNVTGVPPLLPSNSSPVPDALNVFVDDQVIGQGTWEYIDPLNPALGKHFVEPEEFIVVGPAESFQIKTSEETIQEFTIVGLYDPDTMLPLAPPPYPSTVTRFLLVVGPPSLTGFPVSMLGRQIIFTSGADDGASRFITGYSTNYVVINREDLSDQTDPNLSGPIVGDTFDLDTDRQGSEQVNTTSSPATNIFILPSPPPFVPNPDQANLNQGNVDVSVGPQPGSPVLTSGVDVPPAITVYVADQATTVGLPVNVNVP
jgi:hypothetical protein